VRQQSAQNIAVTAPPGWRTAGGRVVAADISGARAEVTIDVGSSSGVQQGNAVLAPGGLVGQILRVSANAATVRLVSDPQSTIGVRVSPSKEMGVVTGGGMGADLHLEVLNPAAEVDAADAVQTLGSTQRSGIPAEVPVGTVAAMDTEPAGSGRVGHVAPVTGMTTLDTVLVLTERR
jgi:rod shape-determining protein MreC